ncbi:hypothetical protein U9M48_005278 [Paspalum notatum var. saurae]|uniref:RING-type domain-containing protein n=1 Tax=Paspalum notatum var. saurae TaxID=547442 RepID=A0AAQ3PQH6_PASNO
MDAPPPAVSYSVAVVGGFRYRRVVNCRELVFEGETYVVETTSYEELSSEDHIQRMQALERADSDRGSRPERRRGFKRARLAASDDEAIRGLRQASAGDAGVPGDCAVCLQDFGAEDTIRAMPCSQSHAFHQDCILGWLRVNSVCPLCRHALPTPQQQQQQQEDQGYYEDEDDGDDSDEDDYEQEEDGDDRNYQEERESVPEPEETG